MGFAYDDNGNTTVLTTPSGIPHGFEYNRVNHATSYETPFSGSYRYTYDRDRNLRTIQFPSGKAIENVYDQSRLEKVVTPEGEVDVSYLCAANVGSLAMGAEQVRYGYDGSLVTSETLSETVSATLGYAYNNDFLVSRMTYAGGSVDLAHDSDGLLIRSGAFTLERNAQNGLPETVSGGSFSLGRAYDGYGELEGESARVGGVEIHSWTATRSEAGRIVTRMETVNGTPTEMLYAYDSLGRLLSAARDGVPVEEYRYGPNGERAFERNVLRDIPGREFTHSIEDHLLTAGETVYQYDADGFLTTRSWGSELTRYRNSARGELLSVTLPDTTAIEYVHDPLGRRIAKKVNGAITEKYLWQGMTRLLAMYDGSDTLLMRFEYADARMPVAMTRDGSTYYLAYDQVGSLRAVITDTGTVTRQIAYDSFGNILADSNPSFTMPFGFAGGLHDPDTSLVRFGLRDYDPEVGRWTAKDPILFAGGDTNLYGYVLSDPVNLVDPYGLWAWGDS